ncbi:MAG: hypothetical protein H7A33_01020 [Deltaproteobacteria bacterium]|nr:hypothetical protein [Deltaproteobacteria bacterium]
MGTGPITNQAASFDVSSFSKVEGNAEFNMVMAQLSMAEDYDNQLQSVMDKIKLLSDVKSRYRENIRTLQNVMAMGENTSRDKGERYIELSAEQMSTVFNAMEEFEWDYETGDISSKSLDIYDTGSDHKLDESEEEEGAAQIEVNDDRSKAKDWGDYFSSIAKEPDADKACEMAGKVGDDDGQLAFYYGHTNNKTEDGRPKFALYSDFLQPTLDHMNSLMSDVEQEVEALKVTMDDLIGKKRKALESVATAIELQREVKRTVTNFMS